MNIKKGVILAKSVDFYQLNVSKTSLMVELVIFNICGLANFGDISFFLTECGCRYPSSGGLVLIPQ